MKKRNRPKAGSTCTTTDPIIVPKPDLRRYNRRPYTTPVDAEFAERMKWAVFRRMHRPEVTRWKTSTGGVVDQYGAGPDAVKYYTGPCHRPGCKLWYQVRREGDGTGAWPRYCSDDCKATTKALSARKAARRIRAGQTDGRRKPVPPQVQAFDPDSPDAFWTANEIVDGEVTSSNQVFTEAEAYLNSIGHGV